MNGQSFAALEWLTFAVRAGRDGNVQAERLNPISPKPLAGPQTPGTIPCHAGHPAVRSDTPCRASSKPICRSRPGQTPSINCPTTPGALKAECRHPTPKWPCVALRKPDQIPKPPQYRPGSQLHRRGQRLAHVTGSQVIRGPKRTPSYRRPGEGRIADGGMWKEGTHMNNPHDSEATQPGPAADITERTMKGGFG